MKNTTTSLDLLLISQLRYRLSDISRDALNVVDVSDHPATMGLISAFSRAIDHAQSLLDLASETIAE